MAIRRVLCFCFGLAGLLALLIPPAAAEVLTPGPLESLIRARLSTLRARASVHAIHVPTGTEIAINADEPMNTASVIKVPIMMLAYADAEAGRLDFDERRELTLDDYRRGTGLLQGFTPGLQPTLRDLVRQMIVTSDNIGTDISLAKVGRTRLNTLLAQAGFPETRSNMTTGELFKTLFVLADPRFASLTDGQVFEMGVPPIPEDELQRLVERLAREPELWLGRSTAREMTRLLLHLVNGDVGSPSSTQQMLDLLRAQLFDSRLPRFIKERAVVGHKTGDFPPFVLNDVGIIFHEGGPTVVSVFVNDNQGTTLQVEEIIGRIAEDLVIAWSSQ
jgi:beta-lactamase class A